MNYFEIFLCGMVYTLVVIGTSSVVLAAIGTYLIKIWFQQREEYIKRMSLPEHVHSEYESSMD